MQRGEVWWANLPGAAGRRLVVLLSRDESYAVRSLVIIAPLTTRIRGLRAEVSMGRGDGLPQQRVINLDTLETIAKTRLQERITVLRPEKVAELDAAIHFALGLDH